MKRIFLSSALFVLCFTVPSWAVASDDSSQEQGPCLQEITEEVVEQEPCEEEAEPEEEMKSRPQNPQRDVKYEIDRQLKGTGLEFERYYPGEARPISQSYHKQRTQIEPFVFVEDEAGGTTEEEEEGENDDEASD